MNTLERSRYKYNAIYDVNGIDRKKHTTQCGNTHSTGDAHVKVMGKILVRQMNETRTNHGHP